MADLQSKIRFIATADAAVKTIRDLKREYLDLNKAAVGADVGPSRADFTVGTLAAKRVAANEAKRLTREAAEAEKAAALEAAATQKAAVAGGLAAKRAAAAEEKRLAREAATARTAADREIAAAAKATAAAQKAAAIEGLAARRAAAAEARKLVAQQTADENKARTAKQAADRTAAQKTLSEARQAREQQRQLSFQVTDIAVGLSTGQSPFYVLLQQGGQLKDTFGGIGNAVRALLGLFTPLRVLVGGVAAGFGAIALGAIAGQRESAALNKTLALTGNVAGTSLGQVNALATDIAKGQNAAIGSVRETLAALLASGSITQTSLAATARAVTALQKLTGDSSEDAIKAFDGQADNVTEWVIRSNKAYNFLTAQQVAYIRSLEAQGKAQEAIKFANDQLAATLTQRTAPALGTVEKLWIGIKNAISGGKDLLLALGRDTTPEDTVAKLKARLAALQAGSGKRGGANDSAFIAESAAEQKALTARIALQEKRIAATQAADKKRADAALKEQQKQFEESKAYTDAIAQLSAAGAQTELANTLAALDKKQSAIELRNARGLLAAADYNRQLNAIDQQRLKAQEATLQRQLDIEVGKEPGNPVETVAKSAAIVQLNAQLVGVRSQIAQTAAKGQEQASADALSDARRKADEWASIWQQAYTAIRQFTLQNAQTQAQAITDPLQRAAEESRLATEQIRQQFEELKRDLTVQLKPSLDPGQREVLLGQLRDLSEQASRSIEETSRKAQFDSLKTQYGELADLIATKERGIDAEVQRGQRSTESAEESKRVLREAQLAQLQLILDKLNEIAKTPAEKTTVEDVKQRVGELKTTADELGTTFRTSAGREFSQLFRDISTGAQTALGAVKSFISGIASAMLDVISRRLGESLLNSLLPKDGGGGSGFGSLISSAASAVGKYFNFFHAGGIAGRPGGDRRPVNPAVFAFAPRYHSGGIAGLKSNEVPAILQAGEEVLTANDPRHSRNGGAGGGVNVGINVTVTGAQGSSSQQEGAGANLGSMLESAVQATIDRWATREKRSGGLLAARS